MMSRSWRSIVHFKKVEEMPFTLSVKNHKGDREDLKLIDAHVGKETLGVFLAPNGSMETAIYRN